MKTQFLATFGLAVFVACVTGCVDYGRGALYEVTLQATRTGVQTEDEKVAQLVRDALAEKGFEELSGMSHMWRKRGTTVRLYRDTDGKLILRVGAFGSKHDIRVSEQTERELLVFLRGQPGIELAPATPPTGGG